MINKFKNKFKRNSGDPFIKGFSVLFSGTAVTQMVSLLLAPILTRLYSPSDFGINSIYISVLTIFGVIATLRLNSAISITNSKADRIRLSRLSVFSSIIFSLLLLIVIFILYNLPTGILNVGTMHWLWFLPISTLLLGIYETQINNILSQNKFKVIAKVTVLKVATQGVSQVILSFLGFGYIGLILGNILSILVGVFFMLEVFNFNQLNKFFDIRQHKIIFWKFIKFPKYAFPAELASIASFSLIPLIIAYLYTVEVAGYFALANRLIGIPIGLFGNSLRQIYLRQASQDFTDNGNVEKAFLKTSKILVIIGIPCAIGIYALGPKFFEIIFGKEWSTSGLYIRALILLFISRIIVTPLLSTVNIINKQHIGLIINVVLVICLILSMFIYKYILITDPVNFLFFLSIVLSAIYFIAYIWIFKIIKKQVQN